MRSTKSIVWLKVKAKFHYAILLVLRPASELVADLLASWNLAYHALSSSLAGLRPDCRPGLRPGDLVADLLARARSLLAS